MATSSTKALRDLLLWARRERIVLSSISIGGLSVTVDRDYLLTPPSGPVTQQPAAPTNIYQQYAGKILDGIAPEVTTETVEPTEEDE